jgi:hypothetical protein
MAVDVVLDGGAYATLSAVVLSRGLIHASGPYRCDNIRIRGRATMTNTPPNGAFRGFGAPQTSSRSKSTWTGRCGTRHRSGADSRNQCAASRRPDCDGQKLGKDCSALTVLKASGEADRFQAAPPKARRQQSRFWGSRCSFTVPGSPAAAKSNSRRRRRWR